MQQQLYAHGRPAELVARTTVVYLLHLEPAYSAPYLDAHGRRRVKVAGHYLGSTALDVADRIAQHVAGAGSPLIRAAIAAGCRVELVRTWPGGRQLERQLKRQHHHARYCSRCTPASSSSNDA